MKCYFDFDPAREHFEQIAARLPKIFDWLNASLWQVGPVDLDILPDQFDEVLINTLNPSLCDSEEVFVRVERRAFVIDTVPDTEHFGQGQTTLVLYVDLNLHKMGLRPEWQIEQDRERERLRKEEEESRGKKLFGLFRRSL